MAIYETGGFRSPNLGLHNLRKLKQPGGKKDNPHGNHPSTHTHTPQTLKSSGGSPPEGHNPPRGSPSLVAFHPRPQIASDLGRNVTCSFNPHRNRNQFPSGNEILACGRRFKSQPASTRCDLKNRKPNPPLFTGDLNSSNRKHPQAAIAELGPPGGRKSQNRRPQGH